MQWYPSVWNRETLAVILSYLNVFLQNPNWEGEILFLHLLTLFICKVRIIATKRENPLCTLTLTSTNCQITIIYSDFLHTHSWLCFFTHWSYYSATSNHCFLLGLGLSRIQTLHTGFHCLTLKICSAPDYRIPPQKEPVFHFFRLNINCFFVWVQRTDQNRDWFVSWGILWTIAKFMPTFAVDPLLGKFDLKCIPMKLKFEF